MSPAPQIVVFDRDWSEPHDGTGEGGEARVYALDVTSAEWAPHFGSTEDVVRALRDGDEAPLWDLLCDLDQDHVGYDSEPQASAWPQHWVLYVAPGGASIRAEGPWAHQPAVSRGSD